MDRRLLDKYLGKSTTAQIEPFVPHQKINVAVVIPVLAELEYLPETLQSLAANPEMDWGNTIIVLVINSSSVTSAEKVAENLIILEKLRDQDTSFTGGLVPGKHLFWIDANAAGKQISEKGGVGEARKLGMDNCLPFFDWDKKTLQLLFCLDADTVVSNNYLSAGKTFFKENQTYSVATFEFAHREGHNTRLHQAIIRYELFMRYYMLGLKLAGSPYAFNALGSAIATTAECYIRADGMRKRNGGEDFYFMQAASKYGQSGVIKSAQVSPSARPSDRVPFGTGPKVAEIAAGNELLLYNPNIFLVLKKIYATIESFGSSKDFETLPLRLSEADPVIDVFMNELKLFHAWQRIYKNTRKEITYLKRAFNTWFDAFRTLKFVHMCENDYPEFSRVEPVDAFSFLNRIGISITESVREDDELLLNWLRKN
ncbi:MAG: glycosyltransferase family 2 protein [Lentisphaerae bacterium]|nr:glycosyltransferase family 2 protein [Lentisphaerota bacterium]MCP4102854.1 glycosyltransferase family 2 protein [Lentisphaerota bacterium]